MKDLNESKIMSMAYGPCLLNAVLTKEGIEYFFYIYIATVI